MGFFPALAPLSATEQHNKQVFSQLMNDAPPEAVFDTPDLMSWPAFPLFRRSLPRGKPELDDSILVSVHKRYFPVGLHDHYYSASYLELLFVVYGSVYQQVGTFRSKLNAGDVLLIAPGTKHAFFALQDDCLVYNLNIQLDTFETYMPGIMRSQSELSTFLLKTLYKKTRDSYMIFHTGDYLQCDNRLADLVALAEHPTPYYREQAVNFTQLLLFDLLLYQSAPPLVSLDETHDGINATTLVEYIKNHSSTVTVNELCQVFNYSDRQISRIFKAATGQTVSEYIQLLRMEQFLSLLVGSDIQINRAMELAGINSTSRFFTQFREQYGLSPAQYRNTYRITR